MRQDIADGKIAFHFIDMKHSQYWGATPGKFRIQFVEILDSIALATQIYAKTNC